MVGPQAPSAWANFHTLLAVAQDKAQPLIYRLAPTERARVIMALLGIALVGMALMAMVVIVGRRLRRIARSRPRPVRMSEDDWYRKPLVGTDGDESPPPDSPPDSR